MLSPCLSYLILCCNWIISSEPFDLIYKSQNTPVPYPTMLHSEQKCAHFCSEWSIVGYGTGAFWDLWNWSITVASCLTQPIIAWYCIHVNRTHIILCVHKQHPSARSLVRILEQNARIVTGTLCTVSTMFLRSRYYRQSKSSRILQGSN